MIGAAAPVALLALLAQPLGGAGDSAGVTLRLVIPSLSMDYAPTWSRDGGRLLFFSWREGVRDLWLVSSAGGEPVRVESGLGNDQFATWSPDGAMIAYTTQAPINQEILLLPVGGTPRTLVAHPAEDYHPSWSPDARWIAFTSNRLGTPDVWVTGTAEGDTARLLIGSPAIDGYASWSPAGDRILFQSSRSGILSIWAAPYADGACGEPVPLVAGGGAFAQPRWSPTGDRVCCVRTDGGGRRLVVVDAAAGAPSLPRPVPLPDSLAVSYPDWSPDGRSIAFTAYANGASRIWVVSDSGGFGAYQEWEAPRRK